MEQEQIDRMLKIETEGMATAIKSGKCFHIVIPKLIERTLKIENRDVLFIKVRKTGMTREKSKRKAPSMIEGEASEDFKGPPNPAEFKFVQRWKISQNPIERHNAEKTFGKERIQFLIDNFCKNETQN